MELHTTPLIGAFGREVSGLDLSKPLDRSATEAIHAAFLAHKLLVFREQKLTPAGMIELGRSFGTLDVHPYIESLPDHPEVIAVVKEPEERFNFGGGWHAEVSFYERPAQATMLYARDVPAGGGGDTLLADMAAAYDALSDGMKQLVSGLSAIHSAERVYGPGGAYAGRQQGAATGVRIREEARQRVEHPVVRTHPETGEKILYVNRAFTTGIKGLRADEAAPLLGFLFDHVTRTEFCTRLHWEVDTLAFWDNRSTQHYALNDYPGERREMLRIVIEGDRPY